MQTDVFRLPSSVFILHFSCPLFFLLFCHSRLTPDLETRELRAQLVNLVPGVHVPEEAAELRTPQRPTHTITSMAGTTVSTFQSPIFGCIGTDPYKIMVIVQRFFRLYIMVF